MTIEVDLNLVEKYNKPGPRYTSYPTAPHFSENVGLPDWERTIQSNNLTNDRDLSLYFHIPYCDTLCYFCGCTTVITRNKDKIEDYLTYLFKELDLFKSRINPDRKVVQQAFGGGTPTYMSPEQIRRLGNKILETFRFDDNAEVACEMDPRGLTRDHVQALYDVGFNRASIGVQDFDPAVQKAVNRINSREMITEIVDWTRDIGYQSLNLDLIYGLPLQTRASFEKTLQSILEMKPDRLAVFNYAHVPWMKPHQKLIREEDLPGPEEKLQMLKMIIETLTSSGYVYIGMDHFALENDELTVAQREKTLQRNFQGYSTKAGADIYGFGMSSISQLEDIYAQSTKNVAAYYKHLDQGELPIEKGYLLTEDDKLRRSVIMRLMCDLALNYAQLSQNLGVDFKQHFDRELNNLDEFVADELLVLADDRLTVTNKGRLFIRNIAMTFDAYLGQGEGRFSKTV
ncbi:MAG: oxygen-independent coproporphyrinogen III oxidase [Lentisphaeria bacterium]|nr:oxygen-independent coproporphyrinogen III oxidase [Candidatus Neomarinimicrobiota bacterium]MCF7842762.1 oxygen-independent coproporphyrinogen III oxidase [Lentisphaeria bacterium]